MPKRRKETDAPDIPDGGLPPELVAIRLQQRFGETAASTGKIIEARDYISTQCAMLDYIIGRPGIPTGGLTNIYGEEGSGKSTLVYQLIAEVQKRGGYALLYDAEGAYDRDRAERIGIDYDKLIMLTPPHLEGAFDEIEAAIIDVKKYNPDALMLIAIDSVAAALTKAQLEGGYEDSHPAAPARAVSQALPKLLPHIIDTKTALVVVGQLRAKLTIGPSWGGPQTTQVAEGALRYYSFLRMYFRKNGEVGEKGEPTGITSVAEIRKNKTAPPYRTATFEIDFLNGVNKVSSKLALAQKLGLVVLTGGWYKYGETSFRSSDFGDVLEANPEIEEQLALAPLLWQS